MYGFVGNAPVNEIDPFGLMSPKCIAAQLEFNSAIVDLAKDFANYNPIKDAIGGWTSRRSPKPTVPGGHAESILNKMNRVERALRRIAQDCKDDYKPPKCEPKPEPQPVPAPRPTGYLSPYSIGVNPFSRPRGMFANPGIAPAVGIADGVLYTGAAIGIGVVGAPEVGIGIVVREGVKQGIRFGIPRLAIP